MLRKLNQLRTLASLRHLGAHPSGGHRVLCLPECSVAVGSAQAGYMAVVPPASPGPPDVTIQDASSCHVCSFSKGSKETRGPGAAGRAQAVVSLDRGFFFLGSHLVVLSKRKEAGFLWPVSPLT